MPETVEARAGFDVRQFVDVAGLGAPVAVNFVWVGGGGDGGIVSSTAKEEDEVRRTSLWSAPCGIATPATTSGSTVAEGIEDMGEGWRVDLR